jgi:hypothetical protein
LLVYTHIVGCTVRTT